MPRYDAVCPQCGVVQEYLADYEDRERTPFCFECEVDMERTWLSAPYVTPESLYVDGTVTQRGKRAILNDVDDPWSGTPLEGQSEEYVAKTKELRGQAPNNWGDRKGTIVFDTAGGKK